MEQTKIQQKIDQHVELIKLAAQGGISLDDAMSKSLLEIAQWTLQQCLPEEKQKSATKKFIKGEVTEDLPINIGFNNCRQTIITNAKELGVLL